MLENATHTAALQADVETLRSQFPRTADLYKEVCALMFFRYAITPTTNRLYQLVRKGSMSTPTEALSQFWKTLRERSRVTIEHPDLPDELRSAAGELVATLWKSAQSKSLESIATLQADAAIAVDNAKADLASVQVAHEEALQLVENLRSQLRASENDAAELREMQAAAAATREGLEERLKDARCDLGAMQARLSELSSQHADERERLADRACLAEERFADMEKRALQEIDRQRTAAAKLQKVVEAERADHIAAIQRARVAHDAAQSKIAELSEQVGALQNVVDVLKNERDRDRLELQSVRAQMDAAIRQSAADGARAEHLRDELERCRIEAQVSQNRTAGRGAKSKRRRKVGSATGT
jgi:chromosome segregation ATPase